MNLTACKSCGHGSIRITTNAFGRVAASPKIGQRPKTLLMVGQRLEG
jgi:hypothetical protein